MRIKRRTEWKRAVGFTIEQETRERLEALASERGKTLSALVRDIVEETLRQQDGQQAQLQEDLQRHAVA